VQAVSKRIDRTDLTVHGLPSPVRAWAAEATSGLGLRDNIIEDPQARHIAP
jgi:hypothetical protein